MSTTKQACEIAGTLPDVTVRDHFGSDAFRTPGGIFATVWHETQTVNLALTPEQQRQLVALDAGFAPIDNAWGRRGWTVAKLDEVERERLAEALRMAWHNSAEKAARGARRLGPPRKKKVKTTKKR